MIRCVPWWNPAAENQATDRADRIGQTQSLRVIKLVAQGTIEERILSRQERKAALDRELCSRAAARRQPLVTQDDVQALLLPMSSGRNPGTNLKTGGLGDSLTPSGCLGA